MIGAAERITFTIIDFFIARERFCRFYIYLYTVDNINQANGTKNGRIKWLLYTVCALFNSWFEGPKWLLTVPDFIL